MAIEIPAAKHAIFLNGVYKSVLDDICAVQQNQPNVTCYLQPYKTSRIKMLSEAVTNHNFPIRLYISTTDDLGTVSYAADIVDWDDKRQLSKSRLADLNDQIEKYQPEEKEVYLTNKKGEKHVNLISVKGMERLKEPFTVGLLTKTSNNIPVKKKTTAGGWSYVYELSLPAETESKEALDAAFKESVDKSMKDDSETRKKRLAKASKLPERISAKTNTFRRNPDVAAEVLIQANGKCGKCKKDAPFLRAKDHSPYLEVHHKEPLAEGGEDTVENAAALCPNCHREIHHGVQD